MGRAWIRTTLIVVVVLGFLLLWASVAFGWPTAQWIVLIGYALLAIGALAGLIRRRRQPRHTPSELSASDAYSDLQLGRSPITHYPRDEASTSQIGDPPGDR
jgi:amino acid transporter